MNLKMRDETLDGQVSQVDLEAEVFEEASEPQKISTERHRQPYAV